MDEPGFTLKEARVCIIGLGLMGGSLALALRPHVRKILAVDQDEATCDKALRDGTADRAGDRLELAGEADLVILATPMRTLVRQVGELAAILKPGAVLMDLGSVKGPIVEAMNALPETVGAVAGHPMCGKEVSGLAHADGELFRRARFVLCRTDRTTAGPWALAHELVRVIGAEAVETDANNHDAVVAVISHLPYILASALAKTAADETEFEANVWELASSGFRDTSRLAASDPNMMADILMMNSGQILAAIAFVQSYLRTLTDRLIQNDYQGVWAMLAVAQQDRLEWERVRGLR
jgi:prephenate dehydrogenase